jgi:hypothetical protein
MFEVCTPAPAHDALENESQFFKTALPVAVRFVAGGAENAVGTGLSFQDFTFCQISTHGLYKRKPAPSWVFDSKRLQEIITLCVERRADIYQPDQNLTLMQRLAVAEKKLLGRQDSLLRALDKACARFVELKNAGQDTSMAQIQVRTIDGQLRTLGRAGEIVAACIFLSLRVGYTSPQVSNFLHGIVSPPQVRAILCRAKQVAIRLENGTLRWGASKLCAACKKPIDTRAEPSAECHSLRTVVEV